MQQQSLPETKISSPYLHYQYICVSCPQSRICYAALLLSNVQNLSFSHEPLEKDGEGKKEFNNSMEMVIYTAPLTARACLDVQYLQPVRTMKIHKHAFLGRQNLQKYTKRELSEKSLRA